MNNETKICNVCDKLFKKKNVNKHNRSKRHIGLSSLVVNRFTVKNPELMDIDNILKKYRNVYDRKFESYSINCYFNTVFDKNQIIIVKLKRMISIVRPTFIRQKLLKKIYSLERNEEGYKYSFISEMKIEFIACLSSMTFKNYLQQPKQMTEWSFIKKMKSNPRLMNTDMDIRNPSIFEIRRRIFWLPEEDDGE